MDAQSLDNNLLKRFDEKVGKESSKRTNKKRDAGMNIQTCLLSESQQTKFGQLITALNSSLLGCLRAIRSLGRDHSQRSYWTEVSITQCLAETKYFPEFLQVLK